MPHRTFRDLPEFDFWRVLHEIAEDHEAGVRRRFVRAVERMLEEIGRPARGRFLNQALARGDVAAAVDALPWEVLEAALQEVVDEELSGVLEEAARATSRQLKARMEGRSLELAAIRAGTARAEVALAFDLQNPRAIRWLERHGAELVRQVTEESRRAIRQTLVRQFREFRGPRSSVNAIREVVGLTRQQGIAVANFREALEQAVHLKSLPEATREGLEELTRFERAIRERLARGESIPDLFAKRFRLSRRMGLGPLNEDRIDLLVSRYRERQLRLRAENIARTETIEASAEGQRQLWREAEAEGLISDSEWEREWVAIVPSDGRTCRLCIDLDGTRAPLGGLFIAPLTPSGIEGPTRHPSCRCTERIVRKRAQAAAAA